MMQMNNQSQGPCRTLTLSGCFLATYVPLRSEWSASVPEMVIRLCHLDVVL